MFRNARKGYDKGDVHRYIEEMNIRFAATEERLKQQIAQLEQELRETSEKIQVSPQMDPEVLTAKEQENEALRHEIESLKKQLESAILPSEATAPAQAVSDEVPLSYEEASRRLGDILLKANLDADRIVAEAEAEATRQLTGAEKQADDIRLDAAVTARLMTDRVKRRLTQLTSEYIESLDLFSAASTAEYQKLCEELKSKLNQVGSDTAAFLQKVKRE